MKHYLDDYVVDLLHIKDAKYNKLIDLGAADVSKTYYLSREGNDNFSEYMLLNIEEQIGHIARMVLANSSISKMESLVGRGLSHLSWKNGHGKQDAAALDKFIRETYKNISFKGINPLFLSVGALRWQVQVSQNEFREVLSPLLIFPIKLIRSASSTPVSIEFVDDDIYFNPCLYQKMLQTLPSDTAERFPHPNGEGATFEEPVDLEKLGDGNVYFASVERYVRECRGEEKKITFEFLKDVVAISEYEHSDLCMYYDYLRNREQIRQHHLVRSVFDPSYQPEETKPKELSTYPYFVLPHDSVQEDMILRTLQGESMVIKGPPGTGKTVTIANMIAALMAEQKNVLFVSTKISALSEVYHKLPGSLTQSASIPLRSIRQPISSPLASLATFSKVINAVVCCPVPGKESTALADVPSLPIGDPTVITMLPVLILENLKVLAAKKLMGHSSPPPPPQEVREKPATKPTIIVIARRSFFI